MGFDDETIKLYAAGYDEVDEEDDEEEFDLDEEDGEEEEEELRTIEVFDDMPAATSTHAEEAILFAAPSTPIAPYEPPQNFQRSLHPLLRSLS